MNVTRCGMSSNRHVCNAFDFDVDLESAPSFLSFKTGEMSKVSFLKIKVVSYSSRCGALLSVFNVIANHLSDGLLSFKVRSLLLCARAHTRSTITKPSES